MRKIGLKSSSSQGSEDGVVASGGKNDWFKNNQRPIIAMAMIVLMAFFLRIYFAYGVSSGSGFALSGGTSASEHLHTIVEIVTAGTFFGADGALFYPFGSVGSNPPLMDIIVALFAMIPKACGMSAVAASEATLAWSAVIFGTLSCIAMYYLGKEMLGSKTAGYLSALFLALCPVVITQTVFSNGTEIAFVAFLFILMAYFMAKGVKLLNNETPVADKFGAVYAANKAAMKYALISGLFLALTAYSWNGFRSVVVMAIFAMAILVLVDRFRSKDARPVAMFFSITILIGVVLAAPYYIVAGLWDLVFSGVLIAAVLAVVVCMLFAATQTKPWTATIPAFIIALAAVFVALYFVAPAYFTAVVSGNSLYSGAYATLMSSSVLSLSTIATNFGFVTMWFGVIMVGYMLYRLPKNLSSVFYVYTIIWMVIGMYLGIKSTSTAVVFAPMYAIGFAAVIIWLFKVVDFKEYFTSFKGCDIKTIWRKIIKPTPFVAILAVILLVCAPNALYAIDGSISNNETDKYNNQMDDVFQKELVGALGYYIKTDSDWKVNDTLSGYNGVPKDGALVTWVDYSADSTTFGDFESIVDTRGNGTAAMSNILLSSGSNGESTAAMLLYLISYYGIDNCRSALTSAGLSSADFNTLKAIIEKPSEYRMDVIENPDKYGILRTNVTDENISYIYGKVFLAENYSTYKITSMYEAVADACGKDITYFMVSGNMFPIYYGYSSVFATMAFLNGYVLADSYGTVTEFLSVDDVTKNYGIYGFTESMYNTLMWRSYIGMSPEEAGFTGTYAVVNYISALSLSDGTYKATPGYGLGNYVVDEDHWYVMYNADKEATLSSDGWVKTLYKDAIAAQENDGGFINYLSGMPIVMKYVDNGSRTAVSGTVVDSTEAAKGVSGIRVAVIDKDGVQRATTFTDSDGKYTVLVSSGSKIVFATGVETLVGGSTIKTIDYMGGTTIPTVVVPATSISGTIVTSDITVGKLKMNFVGVTSESNFTVDVSSANTFATGTILPDTYTIEVYDGKTLYTTTTYLTAIGVNSGLEISLDTAELTVTLKNDLGVVLPGVTVSLYDNSVNRDVFSGVTDSDGKVVLNATAGTYAYHITSEGYRAIASAVTLDADDKETATVTAVAANPVSITGFPTGEMAIIYNSGYTNAVRIGDGAINVPTGTAGGAVYSIYATSVSGSTTNVYWCTTDKPTSGGMPGHLVSGVLKASSNAKAGTIVFISSDDADKKVPVSADSDGKYSVYLPSGSYTVYATDNSAYAYIGSVTVESADLTQDITMESARKISGYTYWENSSYKMEFVPITVSDIKNVDATLNFQTGTDGAYSFFIPSGAGCKVTATLESGSGYYYKDGDNKVNSLAITISEGTSSESGKNFTAKADDVSVKNGSSAYAIKVGGTEIAAGVTAKIAVSSTTQYVTVDGTYDGKYYYYSGSISVTPGVTTTVTVDATAYEVLTVSGLSESDIVTITAMDDGVQKSKTSTGTTREYYIQSDKDFRVKIVNSDDTKIMYQEVKGNRTIEASLVDSVKVSGYVGMVASGELKVTGTTPALTFNISSSGKYDVTLPSATSYTLSAIVTKTAGDIESKYTGERVVLLSELSTTKPNVINMAVTGGEVTAEKAKDVEVECGLTIDKMGEVTGAHTEIEFTGVVKASESSKLTYLLTGGSSWKNVTFYSDGDHKEQITSITGSGTFYGVGTISVADVAAGSSNLSVVLKDVNGNSVCTGTFDKNDAKWVKTTPTADTTKVNYGKDVVHDSEYRYAVELVNNDNYTKSFTVSTAALSETGWFTTYAYSNEIIAWSTGGITVAVDGYSTLTVYFKVTSVDDASKAVPATVNTTVVAKDVSAISTDYEGDGIEVTGATAKVISEPITSALKVSDLTAEGRGVFNDKGTTPAYVWVLFAVMIILIILVAWLGMRRGVFGRKN